MANILHANCKQARANRVREIARLNSDMRRVIYTALIEVKIAMTGRTILKVNCVAWLFHCVSDTQLESRRVIFIELGECIFDKSAYNRLI